MTIYVCFGRYAGWHLFFDKGVRLILGWVSVAVVFVDIEQMMEEVDAALEAAAAHFEKEKTQ